ncbi:hypothetical protein ACK8OR_01460 [Jannaschia sp. KMU-145]|uniref:hypothetical protein n=1 Tax=Jannaschia halovivens TaxID=3388667 RepID=UPI00396AF519
MLRALLLTLLLAACGRGLTPAEVALLQPLHGATLDTGAVRIVRAPGLGAFPITYDARPRTTCRERIGPPPARARITARTGGLVLFETLLLRPDLARSDFAGAPLDLSLAMFLAHEMTHVWQWQNRAWTGYHPARAFTEQVTIDDPYLLDPDPTRGFLAHGYEQQASLVEEYLCCATLDPTGGRTVRLHALLREVMPVADPATFPRRVTVPWAEDLDGICS